MPPVRLIHFADLHVGMENYGKLDPATGTSSRVRDFLDRLDEVIDYALSHKADLAVFAGDAFKTRDPSPTQQREFARRIKRLSEKIPTLLLVGNHDLPGTASKATSLDIYQVLDIPNVIVGNKPEARLVQTGAGPVFLAWMPYPSRNRLLLDDDYKGKSLPELEQALRDAVAHYLREFAEQAGGQAAPRVLAGHFTVSGSVFGSERTVMLGGDVAVLQSAVADGAWDYVALGHIHKHQNLTRGIAGAPPVVYAGSLERIDFGEENEPKGFCFAEIERGKAAVEFIPVRARPFQTIRVEIRAGEQPTPAVLEAVRLHKPGMEQAVVRVIVSMPADQAGLLDERAVQKAAEEASHLSIQQEVRETARARLGAESAESLSPLELLKRYFETKNVDEERKRELLQAAEELMREEADDGP
ncbi:MAG: exonuclease SbcCD subunit D [Anaerolineales bacterium]|nr:exonuclease SbcCD subunit D [Anaerolineales bacterium]